MGEPITATPPPAATGSPTPDPAASPPATAVPPPAAAAPVGAATPERPPFSFSPYRLELGMGPSWMRLSDGGPNLSGYTFQGRLGQSYRLSDSWRWTLQGVFSHGNYSEGSDSLSRTSFGVETGPEVTIARNIIALGAYLGFHQSFYYSQGLPWSDPARRVTFDNAHVSTFSVRPSLLLFGGLLTVAYQWDHDFGLSVPGLTMWDRSMPAQADIHTLMFLLDLSKAIYGIQYAAGGNGGGPGDTMGEFFEGIQPNVLLEGSYNYAFNQPASGANAYRTNDPSHNRLRLNMLQVGFDRPATARSPVGFGFDFNFGQDPGTFAPRSSINEPVIGPRGGPDTQYFAVRRALLRYRLPILAGFTTEVGQGPAPVGYEGPLGADNFILSRGLVYNLIEPFYFFGLTERMRFYERRNEQDQVQSSVEGVIGVANDWDSVLGHENGPTFFTGVTWQIAPPVTLATNGLVNPARGLFNFLITVKPHDMLTLVGNVDVGSGTNPDTGASGPFAGVAFYQQVAPVPWFNVGAREEYVNDQNAVRTGIQQDLMSVTLDTTFLIPAGPTQFGVGPEIRYTHSFRRREGVPGPFQSGTAASDHDATFGVRAFFRYPTP